MGEPKLMGVEAPGVEVMVRLLLAKLTPEPVSEEVAVEALLAFEGKVSFSVKFPNATGAKTADTLHPEPEAMGEATEQPFELEGDIWKSCVFPVPL
jgi:hypothetical protein